MASLEMSLDGEAITEETTLPHIHGKIKATAAQMVEAMDGTLLSKNNKILNIDEYYDKKALELRQQSRANKKI